MSKRNPTVIKSVDGMKKRFPDRQDDFYIEDVEVKPGKFKKLARMHVDIDDLEPDELERLPRDAYDDDEWEQLDYKIQQKIYEIDPKSAARIKKLTEI